MPPTPAALALLALNAWIVDPTPTRPADTDHSAALSADFARASSKLGAGARGAVIEAAQRLAWSAAKDAADDGQHPGDFYRMIVVYNGFEPAKTALDELCATQAPGLILAVYRSGDVERDAWCVARYGEVDEFLDTAASMAEWPTRRR